MSKYGPEITPYSDTFHAVHKLIVGSVAVERKRSCEIVTLLKGHVVKSSSSENLAAIEGSVF